MKYVQEPSPFPDPQEQVEKKERDELIAKSIKKLKPKYKDILYLYYFKGLSREEVARKLDISPRRVSERVNYSLKLLKKIIKQ
jgi:RNA polymerase sigma-70 factor (ECF subfamily)